MLQNPTAMTSINLMMRFKPLLLRGTAKLQLYSLVQPDKNKKTSIVDLGLVKMCT